MFRTIDYYDQLTRFFTAPWWLYLLMGINFILLAILIIIYPELLAYLVAGFLLLNGLILIVLAFKFKGLRSQYKKWKNTYWIEVE